MPYVDQDSKQLRLIKSLCLALVVLCPLPFGSTRPWTVAFLSIAVGFLLIAWSVIRASGLDQRPGNTRYIVPAAIFFSLTMIWIILQVCAFTPSSWHAPIWSEVAGILPIQQSFITVDRYATITGIMRLLTYAVVFWLFYHLGQSQRFALRVVRTIVIISTICAVYGLIMVFLRIEMILWYFKDAYIGDVTGTFINHNSFATYVSMAAILVCALIVHRAQNYDGDPDQWSLSQFVASVIVEQGRSITIFLILVSALFLTHSRAGLFSGIAGLLTIVVVFLSYARIDARYKWLSVVAVFFSVLFLFWMNGAGTLERLGGDSVETLSEDPRFILYPLLFDRIWENPWFGTGLGTFESVFFAIRTPSFSGRFDTAHNSYLEMALEIGIPATILLYIAMGYLVIFCVWRIITERRRTNIFAAIAAATTVTVGIHSMFDFSLQIPAVTITYMSIMGVCCAQCVPHRYRASHRLPPTGTAEPAALQQAS